MENNEDIIDSRDIISRIEELESEIDGKIEELKEELAELHSEFEETGELDQERVDEIEDELADLSEGKHSSDDEVVELAILKELSNEGEDASEDWNDGSTMIRYNYFEDYARELAEDCCDMKAADAWPFTCIDWEKAADELKMDYTEIDFATAQAFRN